MDEEAQEGGNTELSNENKARVHHRDKIKASVLMDRLQKNALGELTPEMTSQQIKSAEILLKKTVPDLQSITQSTTHNVGDGLQQFLDEISGKTRSL